MHTLEVILQLQLGSDQAAVLSLPSIISSTTPAHFEPSPHLQKWISRVTSLMHSKHPGARWAGLCLALQTSSLSKDLMIESAQNWIAIALPMLSRNESPPTWKACIRLLDYIFSSAVGMPEFQRQLATPNVPKFSTALITLADKGEDKEIRHISLKTLIHLIPLYPTLNRALHTSLISFSFRLLSGSSTSPTPSDTIEDACNLHAVLHFTGGKVGAAPLWRKSLDTALANAWAAFEALRTTYPKFPRSTLGIQPTLDAAPTDPVLAIRLGLDQLKCSASLINTLLTAVTSRPVSVPIGELVKLSLAFLRCTPDESDSHIDLTRRALELSVIPDIWKIGCELVSQLAQSVRHHLTPHVSRIVSLVTHHLEQPLPKSHRIPFLRLIPPLLTHALSLHSPIPPTRLVKALLPHLTILLSSKSEVQQQLQDTSTTTSKKGKKRARGYEGDEVFKVGRSVLCPTSEDEEIVEGTLHALDPLLSNPHLGASTRTLAARLLVTLSLSLPQHPASALSPDPTFHGRVYAKVLSLCNKHVLAGASGWIDSAIGLVVNAVDGTVGGSEVVRHSASEALRDLDVLLHPRLPPLLRGLPAIEAVSLFRSESAKDDKAAQDALGVGTIADVQATENKVMTTTAMSSVATVGLVSSAPPQPWGAATPPHAPIPVPAPAPASAPAPALFASTSTPAAASGVLAYPFNETRQVPSASSSTRDPAPSNDPPKAPGLALQESAVASTSSSVHMAKAYQENDEEDDEEMPEIDMQSDSD